MSLQVFRFRRASRCLVSLACLAALASWTAGARAADGSAAVAGAVSAVPGAATAVAGVIGRIDLEQRELIVATQRYRWEPKRLRVSLGGQAADPSALRVGQFVVLQFEPGTERRVLAIQVGTVN